MGKDGKCIDEIERMFRIVEFLVKLILLERCKAELIPASLDQSWIVFTTKQFRGS